MASSAARGIVLKGNRQAEIVSAEAGVPAGGQVLIRTHAVGLCGSDMGLYLGTYEGPRNYPIYFGHEWSGVVEAVGPGVTRLRPGDKVTGDCSLFCGSCQFCGRDRNLCQRIEKLGITVDGASRQYFLQDERYVYRADPAADLDLVALSEPLAVSAHAARRVAEARPELSRERVLVLGGGTIGLACLFALKYLEGCEHVELYDVVEARVAKAMELGADAPADVVAAAGGGESYGGLYAGHGYDAIFETSGAGPSFTRAVDLLRPLGTVMALGFIPSVQFNLKQVTLKAGRIMGSIGGTGEFERVLDFTLRHPDVAAQLITHRVPFEAIHQAFEQAMDRKNAMKVLVQF
jgi:threonine dehydrogenase-like Zn-dependent dehydrogenase